MQNAVFPPVRDDYLVPSLHSNISHSDWNEFTIHRQRVGEDGSVGKAFAMSIIEVQCMPVVPVP